MEPHTEFFAHMLVQADVFAQRGMGAEGLWIGIIVGLTAAAVLNTLRFNSKTRDKSTLKTVQQR